MSINELPEEILVRILSLLYPSDRLDCALTCRRWAQTIARAPPLLRDVWLVINEHRKEETETFSAMSYRQHENLKLNAVSSFNFNAAFWMKVGPGLRKLEIIDCTWSLEVFHSILQACANLESLHIHLREMKKGQLVQWSELPRGMNLESIQKSMHNLRHLYLECPVNADMLERLLILMPNVSSIDLSHCDRKCAFSSRLPTLGSNNTLISRDDYEQLLRISSASLRTLKWTGSISKPTAFDAFRNCSMLRDLDLGVYSLLDTRLLQNIFRIFPELESLSIRFIGPEAEFRRADLMPILNSRKLRKLYLLCGPVDADILPDLSRMISLESLSCVCGLVDSTRFRILASMPNLRRLVIGNVKWDTECLRILLFELGDKLKTLEIESIHMRAQERYRNTKRERNVSTPQDLFGFDVHLERKFSSLEVLRTSHIPLTDGCLGHISAHHSRLKIVKFSGCNYITDAGLVTLFQHEPLLEEISVSSWKVIDGKCREGLGELCPRLRSLQLSGLRIAG